MHRLKRASLKLQHGLKTAEVFGLARLLHFLQLIHAGFSFQRIRCHFTMCFLDFKTNFLTKSISTQTACTAQKLTGYTITQKAMHGKCHRE